MSMKTKIYIAYHKKDGLISSKHITPTHVGKALHDYDLDMIGDDTGNHISEKNPFFCELTAVYWIWKNDVSSESVGLMHYRRIFDFLGQYSKMGQTEVFLKNMPFNPEKYSQESDAAVEQLVSSYDIIMPKAHQLSVSVKEDYAVCHVEKDIDIVRDIVEERHPRYVKSFDAVMAQDKLFIFNMFIMKREIFNEYAEWLFDILFELENRINIKYYNSYNQRVFGFVAERLLSVFLTKYIKDNRTVKIQYLTVLNIDGARTKQLEKIDVSFAAEDDINIVVSADDNYAVHISVLFKSIKEYASKKHIYNIFLLSSEIQGANKKALNKIFVDTEHINLIIKEVGGYYQSCFAANDTLPSTATYNRFLIFGLLEGLKRVLYLDADMIVLDDLVELYHADLDGYPIGACVDYIMTRFLFKDEILSEDFGYMKAYFNNTVELEDEDIYNYFNAGVMIIDLAHEYFKNFDERITSELRKEYYFQDQDILNKLFKHNYLKLDGRYNVFNSQNEEYKNIPADNYCKAFRARKDPKIIHFAAAQNKPWKNVKALYADFYFKYAGTMSMVNALKYELDTLKGEMSVELDKRVLTTRRMMKAIGATIKRIFKFKF